MKSVTQSGKDPSPAGLVGGLPDMSRHLNVVWQYNWGGLLYPLLEGIALNFTASDEDQALLKFLFNLDYALDQSGEIEPNFTITLATKR